jgi:hypothetical protein
MLSRFRKPPPPDTPDFWDRLEAELRSRTRRSSTRMIWRSRTAVRYLRYGRSLGRPAFHGVMILISVVLVGMMARPQPGWNQTPQADEKSELIVLNGWVPVTEVRDPEAPLVAYAITAKTERFVTFVETPKSRSLPDPLERVAI